MSSTYSTTASGFLVSETSISTTGSSKKSSVSISCHSLYQYHGNGLILLLIFKDLNTLR
ncbi:hypothetical protein HanIR_Chr15g0762691 [Helianthus annuus]|nr:hypothetical protein HanIR_Chr15g0762691 [Helianthus annuus]